MAQSQESRGGRGRLERFAQAQSVLLSGCCSGPAAGRPVRVGRRRGPPTAGSGARALDARLDFSGNGSGAGSMRLIFLPRLIPEPISSPSSMIVAAPLTNACAISTLARELLDELVARDRSRSRAAAVLAVDKTGTLTEGRFRLRKIMLNPAAAADMTPLASTRRRRSGTRAHDGGRLSRVRGGAGRRPAAGGRTRPRSCPRGPRRATAWSSTWATTLSHLLDVEEVIATAKGRPQSLGAAARGAVAGLRASAALLSEPAAHVCARCAPRSLGRPIPAPRAGGLAELRRTRRRAAAAHRPRGETWARWRYR